MDENGPLFILAGNGSYGNRGCEAITRGTVRILRNHFDKPRFLSVSGGYSSMEQFKQQCLNETDASITHKRMFKHYKRFDFLWFLLNGLRVICPPVVKHIIYKDLKPKLSEAEAVLSVGGDNYSLDYTRKPVNFTDLDDLVVANGKPLVIWGASIGPFSKNPSYEKYMINHLRKVYILARETTTVEYLADKGLTENVYRVADPAFLMRAAEPKTEDKPQIEEGAIGLNLSPLMSRFVTHGDLQRWKMISADIIRNILQKTGRTIYLIPHVTAVPANDDEIFLKDVLSIIPNQSRRIVLIPPIFNASETKWIISKMSVFAGARMHSVIASLSCCVPTLSFSYSIKSKGLNKDIFGHTEYCLASDELEPDILAERIEHLLSESKNIKSYLERKIPEVKALAMSSGEILRKILQERSG